MEDRNVIAVLRDRVAGALRERFAVNRPIFLRSAPGRVDVLGGLAADSGGALAQMALPTRAGAAVQLRTDGLLMVHSQQQAVARAGGKTADGSNGGADFSLALAMVFRDGQLVAARELGEYLQGQGLWAVPVVAAWYVLQQAARGQRVEAPVGGATVVLHSTIPWGAGQASSTAVTAAAVAGLADAYGLKLGGMEMALYVHRAERLFGPTSAHVVDAMTTLEALDCTPDSPSRLLRYSAQPHQLAGQIPLAPEVRIVALDTGVRYGAATSTVESLRLAGAMGLRIIETVYRDLGQRHTPLRGYLANLSPSLYRQYFRGLLPRRMRGQDFIRTFCELPERAGLVRPERLYRVRTAVDHLITEHDHAENFLQAMEELSDETRPGTGGAGTTHATRQSGGDRQRVLRRAGRLLLASHHSYRLRLELSCPEADWLVESLMETAAGNEGGGPDSGVYGARISACGGGGTVVALLDRSAAATDVLLRIVSAYGEVNGGHLSVTEAGAPRSAGLRHTPGHVMEITSDRQ